jgi:sugar phosphate permease
LTPEENEEMKKSPLKHVFMNPVNRYVLFGSFIRNVGGSVTTYFLPVFFLRNFPAMKSSFSLANTVNQVVGGLLSAILAGIVAGKYEKKTHMTKAYICAFGCTVALPILGIATL